MDLASEKSEVEVSDRRWFRSGDLAAEPESRMEGRADTTVPLLKLAWARSGDKGDHSNIGVIARDREYVPYIEAALTEQAVAEWMAHTLNLRVRQGDSLVYAGIACVQFLAGAQSWWRCGVASD